MAQVIELPTGDIWNNAFPIEDQSAGAQAWYAENLATYLQTYMFLNGDWTVNMINLPAAYGANQWNNRRHKANQNDPEAITWYDDAIPVIRRIVPFSNISNEVDLVGGAGVYNRNLPLSSQAVNVQRFVFQVADIVRRLSVFTENVVDQIDINGELWDNNLPYAGQTGGAQTEADNLWSGGTTSGNKTPIDGSPFVNKKRNGAFELEIQINGSQDYHITNI